MGRYHITRPVNGENVLGNVAYKNKYIVTNSTST